MDQINNTVMTISPYVATIAVLNESIPASCMVRPLQENGD